MPVGEPERLLTECVAQALLGTQGAGCTHIAQQQPHTLAGPRDPREVLGHDGREHELLAFRSIFLHRSVSWSSSAPQTGLYW